jgi:HlyD family secretion protein
VVAELLTTEALRAPIGATVRIVDWGGPGELAGRLARIEPSAFTKVSALGVEEQRVNALVQITSPRAQWQLLGDGFRVGVRIVTLQHSEALTVPVSAVFPLTDGDAPGAMAAFVLREGRARRVPVTLGGRNGQVAWVQEGLAPGDEVIVYPPASLKDGERVRARAH